jgi:hypothetical protein
MSPRRPTSAPTGSDAVQESARKQAARLEALTAIVEAGHGLIVYVSPEGPAYIDSKVYLEGLASSGLLDPLDPATEALISLAASYEPQDESINFQEVYANVTTGLEERQMKAFKALYGIICGAQEAKNFVVRLNTSSAAQRVTFQKVLSENNCALPEPARQFLQKLYTDHTAYLGINNQDIEAALFETPQLKKGTDEKNLQLTVRALEIGIENSTETLFQFPVRVSSNRYVFVPITVAISYALFMQPQQFRITEMEAKALRQACLQKMEEAGKGTDALRGDRIRGTRAFGFMKGVDNDKISPRAKAIAAIILDSTTQLEIDNLVRSSSQLPHLDRYEQAPIMSIIGDEAISTSGEKDAAIEREDALSLFYLFLEAVQEFEVRPSSEDCLSMIRRFSRVHALTDNEAAWLISTFSEDNGDHEKNFRQLLPTREDAPGEEDEGSSADDPTEEGPLAPTPEGPGHPGTAAPELDFPPEHSQQAGIRRGVLLAVAAVITVSIGGMWLASRPPTTADQTPIIITPKDSTETTPPKRPKNKPLGIIKVDGTLELDKEATEAEWKKAGIKIIRFAPYKDGYWLILDIQGERRHGYILKDGLEKDAILLEKAPQ